MIWQRSEDWGENGSLPNEITDVCLGVAAPPVQHAPMTVWDENNHIMLRLNLRHSGEEKQSLWLNPDPQRGHRDFSKSTGNIPSDHHQGGQGCATCCLDSQTCNKWFYFCFDTSALLIIQHTVGCRPVHFKVEKLKLIKLILFLWLRVWSTTPKPQWRRPAWRVACGWVTAPTLSMCPEMTAPLLGHSEGRGAFIFSIFCERGWWGEKCKCSCFDISLSFNKSRRAARRTAIYKLSLLLTVFMWQIMQVCTYCFIAL